ncbi:MAG: hypothetical protein U1E26_10100 [Coriobacteriia bacterium]|nr:hypothetical protein [Coriobacteriia bacterium]
MQASKDKIRCVLVIGSWRVVGDVHVLAGSRLTDTLNAKVKGFFPVTDVVVTDLCSGEELFTPGYMAVNRDLVAAVFPFE